MHLPSSTRSLRIYPTSAAGPPKPMVPSFRKYRTNCPRPIDGTDMGIGVFCAIADRPLTAMQRYACAPGAAPRLAPPRSRHPGPWRAELPAVPPRLYPPSTTGYLLWVSSAALSPVASARVGP